MASAHFQVVEQLGLRTPNLGEPYYQGKVLLRDGDIRNLSLEEGLDPKTMQILLGLHENEQCLVTRANLGPTSIRVLKTSKIFTDVLPFTPDHSVLEIYKNPPLVSISDILKSPRKRRVSLEANIVTVSPVKNKKRDLKVLNQDEEVLVKLWSSHGADALITDPETPDATVKITCLEVDRFGKTVSLNSTPFTTIDLVQDQHQEVTTTIKIFARDEKTIVEDNNKRLLICPNQCESGCTLHATLLGNVVLSYKCAVHSQPEPEKTEQPQPEKTEPEKTEPE